MNERKLRALQEQFDAFAKLEIEYRIAQLTSKYNELAHVIDPIKRRILDAVKRGDIDGATRLAEQMTRATADFLIKMLPEQQKAIEGIVRGAAIRGAQAVDLAPALFRDPDAGLRGIVKALDAGGGVNIGRVAIGFQYGRISDDVLRIIRERVYRDGLNLSTRLHTRLVENIVEFNRLVHAGLTDGRGAILLGRQLAELRVTDPYVPRYIRDLQSAMRSPEQRRRIAALREALRRVDPASNIVLKEGPLGLRTAVRQVIRAAQTGAADAVDKAVTGFVDRKVRYHAIVIARTEANNAFTLGHNAKAGSAPYVVGSRWNLSKDRPGRQPPCMCEEYASQDWYGLGAGVFPPGELPERPHPNCMCYHTDVVDASWFQIAA